MKQMIDCVISEQTEPDLDLVKEDGPYDWALVFDRDFHLNVSVPVTLFIKTRIRVPDDMFVYVQQVNPFSKSWSFSIEDSLFREMAFGPGEIMNSVNIRCQTTTNSGRLFKEGDKLATIRFCLLGDNIELKDVEKDTNDVG